MDKRESVTEVEDERLGLGKRAEVNNRGAGGGLGG